MSHFSSVATGARHRTAIVGLLVAALLAMGVQHAPPAGAAVASKIAPSVVPHNGGVYVAGDGLTGTTRVTFQGAPGPEDDVDAEHFIVVDAKKVAVQVPPGAGSGPIEVTGPGGAVSTGAAVVKIVQPPAISAVSVRSGQPGEEISITGEHLTGSKKPAVLFGAKGGGLTAATPTELKVKVPAGLPGGPVTLRVVTDGGRAEAPFYIAPAVKAVAPKAGSTVGDTVVTITGTGFTGVDRFADDPATVGVNERLDGVTVGGQPVTRLVAVSDAEIVAQVPPGTDPAAPVVVSTTRDSIVATSATAPGFEYQPIPTITSVSPSWNAVGPDAAPVPVVITGRNLTPTTVVTLGKTVVTGTTVDAQAGTLTFEPPAGVAAAASKITVANTNAAGKVFAASAPFDYVAAPTVAKVAPPTGPAGTSVAVSGTSFTPDTTVMFGTQPATCTVVSFALAQCTAPAGADVADVTVTTSLGTSAPNPKATFTYTAGDPPAPRPPLAAVVGKLSPAYGTTGTAVGLKGANLHLVTRVEFTGAEAPWVIAPNFLVVGPGRIVVTVPPGAASGPLRLTTPTGRSTGGAFIASVRPAVTSIDVVGDATYGVAGNDLLVIKGRGLVVGPVRPVVTIGGKVAPLLSRPLPTAKTIVVKVPPLTGGRESVVVTTPLGTATAEATVYFVPQLKGVKPPTDSRAGGVVVTISGAALGGADTVIQGGGRQSAVTFGGTPVERFVVISAKEIVAVTSTGSASSDPLLVKTEHDGWTGFSDDRARPNSVPVPTVTGVTPNTMTLGVDPAPVTVTGTNLREDSEVLFGTVQAEVLSASADGSALVVMPPVRTTTALVPVSVTNTVLGEELTATLVGGFSYLPRPAITSVTPATGLTGIAQNPVTITGANLRLDTVVRFGGSPAAVQSVAADGRTLTVVPPLRNESGAVAVTVTNVLEGGEQLTATLAAGYTYQLAVARITGKSATTAAPGTTITISGTSFVGVTSVRFGTTDAVFTVANGSTIYATVPATPTGAQGALVDITVVNSTGQPSTAEPATADDWTWSVHPIVTSITPGTGSQGSQVTITGSGFTGATAVRFGTINAVSYTIVSDTSITAVVPTTPADGSVADVIVIARGYTSPEPAIPTANDWTWAPIAVITSMTTPAAAGSTVTVDGRNFTNVRTVTLNGTVVTPTVVSSTRLTFVAPARPGNKVAQYTDKPVFVTNGSGAPSTAEINPANNKMANLFTWL